MTRPLRFGIAFCIVVVCMLPVTGSAAFFPDTAALEKRVAALEKAVATLQGQVAALQKENEARQKLLSPVPGVGGGLQPTESK